MTIYLCKVGEKGEFRDIENELKPMQDLVAGNIEVVPIQNDLVLICNEEAKLHGLKKNRWANGETIRGDFFFCGVDQDEFCSLPSKYNSVLEAIYYEPRYTKAGELNDRDRFDEI